MNIFLKNKKNLGNIVIILGIILILYSLYYNMQIKQAQEKKMAEYSETVEEEPAFYLEDPSDSEVKEKNQESKIERNSITDLKMVIEIPKIKVKAAVVNGTTPKYLREGPGLYEISPLPGEKDANVLIAGHRTTYGAWFRKVDKLVAGDDIIVSFDSRKFKYKVEEVFIVAKNDWSVTEAQDYSALTLTSCHPLGSSKERIIVRAKLDSISEEKINYTKN